MESEKLKKYPITAYLEQICETLKNSPTRFLILTAETAAGKSTVLPLALLESFTGKIVMTEPRRLAALTVANRLSDLNGTNPGEQIGYKVHLENCTGPQTKLEVVTEAILVRQLQADPALEDYNVVVLDEFHERSINTDLALAFLKEAMELREDLYVIIMSATIDTDQLNKYLGENTPVMKIPGRQFPVEYIYNDSWTVEQAVLQEIEKTKGDILVFLPGISDIRKAQENLNEKITTQDAEICVLHSSISLQEQKRIVGENDTGKKRIILSTSIAETSLTVPGITSVIDSGLARISRMNLSTGMETLNTETESEFSACQRAGRAGRVQEGRCIRLWSKANPRIKNLPSEILRADLTSLVLECADRGITTSSQINWLEPPSDSSWQAAVFLLTQLGMFDSSGKITSKGRIALQLGQHPRLANIAIETGDVQLVLKYSNYAQASSQIQKRFLEDLENRLKRAGAVQQKPASGKKFPPILAGFPDRLAKRISEKGITPVEFQFPSGRKAVLYEGFEKADEWIVAPEVLAGTKSGTIFEFEAVPTQMVNEWLPGRTQIIHDFEFQGEKVTKWEKEVYGQIVLSAKKETVSPEDFISIWVSKVQKNGLEALPQNEEIKNFLVRAEFYRKNVLQLQDDLEQELCQKVNDWLPPFLVPGEKLKPETVYSALNYYLNGNDINKEVPVQIQLPNGKKTKVKYEKLSSPDDKNLLIIRPVIEIIIQRAFGCFETPRICGVKVLFRLLSPAQRPLQITDDLENFWTGTWQEICKEMKGRYPKHNWDYRIADEKE